MKLKFLCDRNYYVRARKASFLRKQKLFQEKTERMAELKE